MSILTDVSAVHAKNRRILVLCAPNAVVGGPLKKRFELLHGLSEAGKSNSSFTLVEPFSDLAASSGIRENELLSAAAQVPAYAGSAGFKFFLTSGFRSHAEDVARFSARNEDLLGIDSSEWAAGEVGRKAAADAYALYSIGSVLLENAGYDALLAVGWHSFAPALRLGREFNKNVACEFSTPTELRQLEKIGRESHENAALVNAHAVIASDPGYLADLVHSKAGNIVGLDSNSELFDSLMQAHHAASLIRQKHQLEHVVHHPAASLDERRLAASHVKQIDAELSGSSEFVIAQAKAMGIGHGLALDCRPLGESGVRQLRKSTAELKTASGRPLSKRATLLYASCANSGAKTVSHLVSALSFLPASTALLLDAGGNAELAKQKASMVSASDRLVLLEQESGSLMAASQLLLLDAHARDLSNYSRAVSVCESSRGVEHGPVLLCGTPAPLALSANEVNLNSSPVSLARIIEMGVHDAHARSRFNSTVKRIASSGWDWSAHAQAYANFVSSALR